MDSACPIAQRNAGQTSLDAGITFTLATGNKAENFAFDWLGRKSVHACHSYRESHHPSATGYRHAA